MKNHLKNNQIFSSKNHLFLFVFVLQYKHEHKISIQIYFATIINLLKRLTRSDEDQIQQFVLLKNIMYVGTCAIHTMHNYLLRSHNM